MNDLEYSYLRKRFLEQTGIDLENYKSQQMRRRLESYISGLGHTNIYAFCRQIEKDQLALKELRDFITINVTEFFRDFWAFEELRTRVMPMLCRYSPRLNIWSAGSSNGCEAYTMAIILENLPSHPDYRIVGTDIDDSSLAKASAGGPYNSVDIKGFPDNYRRKYLRMEKESSWVVDELRRKVTFRPQNLLADPFEKGFHLIACRNVTIYFTEEAKDQLNRRFTDSLAGNGVLFIGATEFLAGFSALGLTKIGSCFYQKLITVTPPALATTTQLSVPVRV
jgi:chemotaxis protein methyltransferase CheR